MFGSIKNEDFSYEKLKELLDNLHVEEAKQYIGCYFVKVNNEPIILKFVPSERQLVNIPIQFFERMEITNYFTYEKRNGNKLEKAKIGKWFLEENNLKCNMIFNPHKPMTYYEDSKLYVNTFKGFRFKYDPNRILTKKEKKFVNVLWNHVFEVFCDSNEEVFDYFKKWLCNMIYGNKNETMIFLKSGQGVGKSTFARLIKNVLGSHNCYIASDANSLLGFNGELQNILFVLFEEFRTSSDAEWLQVSNKLKTIITDETITINAKYKTPVNVNNNINVMGFSNIGNFKMENDDRRIYYKNCNSKYKNDFLYFNLLNGLIDDEKVCDAFYHDCMTFYHENQLDKFNSLSGLHKLQSAGLLKDKQELIAEHSHPLYKILKEKILMKGEDINMYMYELHEFVCRYKAITKIQMNKLLTDIDILPYMSNGKKKYKVSNKELREKLKQFISEVDEFDENEE